MPFWYVLSIFSFDVAHAVYAKYRTANTLLQSQADASVISLMAQGSSLNIENGSALTQEDCTALQAMRARIDFLLSNLTAGASQAPSDERPKAENQEDTSGSLQAAATQTQETPEIAMQDALVHDEEQQESGVDNKRSEAVDMGTLGDDVDQTVPETNEVMSLVSDNGESDMNEDEDPPPITTPLNAPNEEPTSAVWPVEHHSSSGSDPGSGNGTLPPSAKVNLVEGDIDGFHLCGHDNGKALPDAIGPKKGSGEDTPEVVKSLSTEDDKDRLVEEQQRVDEAADLLSSPLTPPPTSSEMAAEEDDKENETIAERLHKQSSEQHAQSSDSA